MICLKETSVEGVLVLRWSCWIEPEGASTSADAPSGLGMEWIMNLCQATRRTMRAICVYGTCLRCFADVIKISLRRVDCSCQTALGCSGLSLFPTAAFC